MRIKRNISEEIQNALLECMTNKIFMDITITEICMFAGINRTTFYKYYRNTHEVLNDVIEKYKNELISISTSFDTDDKESMLYSLFEYLKAKNTYAKAFQINSDVLPIAELFGFFHLNLDSTIVNTMMKYFNSEHGIILTNEELIIFLRNGMLALLSAWFSSGCKDSSRSLAKKVASILR